MDKLVESLRVLLENERDGVLHVDGERLRQAKYAGSVEALRKILNEDGWSAEKKIDGVGKMKICPTPLFFMRLLGYNTREYTERIPQQNK